MKGYVLTMDAMIAAITAIGMSAMIAGILSSMTLTSFNDQQLAATGQDILSVLHMNGTMNRYIGRPVTEVNASLQNVLRLLPASYCANITVTIYRTSDFQQTARYAATSNCLQSLSSTSIRRIFADYNSERFGLAEMTLWIKGS